MQEAKRYFEDAVPSALRQAVATSAHDRYTDRFGPSDQQGYIHHGITHAHCSATTERNRDKGTRTFRSLNTESNGILGIANGARKVNDV